MFGRFLETNLGLSIPDGSITTKDLSLMFGIDPEKLVDEKISKLGVLPQGTRLTYFERPKIHTYETSEGNTIASGSLYIAEQYVNNDLVLVSVIPPNTTTTRHIHQHPMEREEYHLLAGSALVEIDGSIMEANSEKDLTTVSPGALHQVRTGNNFGSFLIIMRNAALVGRASLHALPGI